MFVALIDNIVKMEDSVSPMYSATPKATHKFLASLITLTNRFLHFEFRKIWCQNYIQPSKFQAKWTNLQMGPFIFKFL